MEPIARIHSVAAVLLMDDIGAEQIISVKNLMKTSKTGFADALFAEWRFHPDRSPDPGFPLNRPEYHGAQVLVTGRNFGAGSSREAATWALRDYGFRCIVARGYGGIFYNNCIKNGVLPVTLDDESHASLVETVMQDARPIEVDLAACRITAATGLAWSFRISELHRRLLLNGMDAIQYAMTFNSQIEAFREEDRAVRPWIYSDTPHTGDRP
jgi:3-isopropylmalate/(R)-2-methylmalate dehydratase small subunit